MKTKLKKIGNSKGITLSKSLLEQYQFEDEVEIIAQADGLLIMPAKARPREKWEEQFKAAKKAGHHPAAALLGSFSNSFDKKEWTW
ncbi:MAG: AbrB/MazE/SpoVT family DNA-binding domain-containing protein [Chitinophagaceae bacterium]|nr:AbrB/MazE/SpoVT family DNA-binding domain-containing protein [Chitinophagaceae bacterium]